METRPAGWRAAPPALLIGFALPIAYAIFDLVMILGWPPERGYSPRIILSGEGVGTATQLLVLMGLLELARRYAGNAALGLKIAVAGVALALVADIAFSLLQFSESAMRHKWLWKVYRYAYLVPWWLVPLGITFALPPARRAVGIVTFVIVFMTWPIEPLREPLFGWMHLGPKSQFTFNTVLRIVRFASMGGLSLLVAEGITTSQPYVAGNGLRLASRGLWLRVIAALAVAFMTIMLVSSRGKGGFEMLRLFMMAQGFITVIALILFGVGALRAAGAGVPELGGYTLSVGGGASLWAAGVTLAQLPYLYRMLYNDSGNSSWSRSENTEWTTALSTAMPIVVILGVGLLATALSGFAARRANEDLRTDAQGRGIGFVALMVVSLAIQAWMVPNAGSVGNFAMLSLLAAGAGLWGTILMAKLLMRGAEALEAEPTLPPASVVNVGPTGGS